MSDSVPLELEGGLPRYLSDDRTVEDFRARSFVTTGGSLASGVRSVSGRNRLLDPRAAADQPAADQPAEEQPREDRPSGEAGRLLRELLTTSLALSQAGDRPLSPEERLLLAAAMRLHLDLADRAKALLQGEAMQESAPPEKPRRRAAAAKRPSP